jgi:hypothetical protein
LLCVLWLSAGCDCSGPSSTVQSAAQLATVEFGEVEVHIAAEYLKQHVGGRMTGSGGGRGSLPTGFRQGYDLHFVRPQIRAMRGDVTVEVHDFHRNTEQWWRTDAFEFESGEDAEDALAEVRLVHCQNEHAVVAYRLERGEDVGPWNALLPSPPATPGAAEGIFHVGLSDAVSCEAALASLDRVAIARGLGEHQCERALAFGHGQVALECALREGRFEPAIARAITAGAPELEAQLFAAFETDAPPLPHRTDPDAVSLASPGIGPQRLLLASRNTERKRAFVEAQLERCYWPVDGAVADEDRDPPRNCVQPIVLSLLAQSVGRPACTALVERGLGETAAYPALAVATLDCADPAVAHPAALAALSFEGDTQMPLVPAQPTPQLVAAGRRPVIVVLARWIGEHCHDTDADAEGALGWVERLRTRGNAGRRAAEFMEVRCATRPPGGAMAGAMIDMNTVNTTDVDTNVAHEDVEVENPPPSPGTN